MIFLIILQISYLFLSAAVADYAYKKGLSRWGYLFISLFLTPIVGIVIAYVQEDKPRWKVTKYCPACMEVIRFTATKCRFCQTPIRGESPQNAASVQK
jgi:hypothetical protein